MNNESGSDKQKALIISMLYNISEMAQSVAYDINNPLMIIKGYTRKIKKHTGSLEYKDLQHDIEAIEKAGDRINTIIQNLLSYSKEAMDLPLKNTQYLQLVKQAVDTYVLTSNKKVKINFHGNMEGEVNVNHDLCIQCILNILKYAVDVAQSSISPEINIEFRTYKERIELVIRDNGKKLSEDIQSKLFYQTFSLGTENQTLGMGMNTSFNIAKKFKGDLFYDNSYVDNAFVLSFPKV